MSVRNTFQRLLRSLKNYLMKVMTRRVPNMNLPTVTLPSKTAWKVCDESWCPQLGRLLYKNKNDCYETDSDLTRLFYVQERIKRVPSWRKFIADMFYGWGQIKRHHCWQIFYRWRQIRMRWQKCKQTKIRKYWGRVWGIFSYRWSA